MKKQKRWKKEHNVFFKVPTPKPIRSREHMPEEQCAENTISYFFTATL